jgi:hypothetical protein
VEHCSNVKDTCAFTYYKAILRIYGYYIYIYLYVDGGAAVPSGWKNKIFVIWILSVAWAVFFLEINTLH